MSNGSLTVLYAIQNVMVYCGGKLPCLEKHLVYSEDYFSVTMVIQ